MGSPHSEGMWGGSNPTLSARKWRNHRIFRAG